VTEVFGENLSQFHFVHHVRKAFGVLPSLKPQVAKENNKSDQDLNSAACTV
jgi:hypothetical protein